MSKLLRYFIPGATYFVTPVTYRRKPILIENINLLYDSIKEAKEKSHFQISAWVVLPQHMHLIITPKNNDLDNIMRIIKLRFSYNYRLKNKLYRCTLWQRRCWDHIIRDQEDLNRHIDYIHYNPVKHECINDPFLWEPSSIGLFLKNGFYTRDWGVRDFNFKGFNFGE